MDWWLGLSVNNEEALFSHTLNYLARFLFDVSFAFITKQHFSKFVFRPLTYHLQQLALGIQG